MVLNLRGALQQTMRNPGRPAHLVRLIFSPKGYADQHRIPLSGIALETPFFKNSAREINFSDPVLPICDF